MSVKWDVGYYRAFLHGWRILLRLEEVTSMMRRFVVAFVHDLCCQKGGTKIKIHVLDILLQITDGQIIN